MRMTGNAIGTACLAAVAAVSAYTAISADAAATLPSSHADHHAEFLALALLGIVLAGGLLMPGLVVLASWAKPLLRWIAWKSIFALLWAFVRRVILSLL